jgi:pyridoxine 4-dehydrogenase
MEICIRSWWKIIHESKQLSESLGALELKISAADLANIEAGIPANEVAGTRYDAYQMGHLDSEKAVA